MALNPKDASKTSEQLTAEANRPGISEIRLSEILSQLIVNTVEEWKNPGWFTEWVSTTPRKEAEDFLNSTLQDLIDLEVFEYCKDVELMKGQLEMFYSMKNKNGN